MITGLPAPPGSPDSGLAPSDATDAVAPNETVRAKAIALAKKPGRTSLALETLGFR